MPHVPGASAVSEQSEISPDLLFRPQTVQGIVSGIFEIPQQAHHVIELIAPIREDRHVDDITDRTEFRIVMAVEEPTVAFVFSGQFSRDDVPEGRDRAADALMEKTSFLEVGEASHYG